jgi:hypothetical protein
MQIGFSQPVELAWMEASARLVAEGHDTNAIRERLDQLLGQTIAVNTTSKRSSRNKRLSILMKTWVTPNGELVDFRDNALACLKEAIGNERVMIHYAMLIATYPFFAVVAGHAGRLFRLQDQCSMDQLKRRCREELGQRDTVSFAVTRVVRTLMDWGLIAKGDRTGIYTQALPINVIAPVMISLLAEAVLIASGERDALAESTLGSPCLFPSKLAENSIMMIGQSSRLSLAKNDYGGYRLKRMNVVE